MGQGRAGKGRMIGIGESRAGQEVGEGRARQDDG